MTSLTIDHLDPPSTVRPQAVADRNSTVEVDQAATLLDVEFEKRSDASESLRIWAEAFRIASGPTHCLRHSHAIGITQP